MAEPPNDNRILTPKNSGIHVLQQTKQPYRPSRPFRLPGQPELIDPMVTLDQIAIIRRGEVVAQCNCPEDENDYNSWQEVMLFLRRAKVVLKQS